MNDEEKQKLKDQVFTLLSYRPRSIFEIKTKLEQFAKRRHIPSSFIETAIEELCSKNFLNDEQFAVWWVEQRALHRPKGKHALISELRQKGVDSNIIERVLTSNPPDADEFTQALTIATKKATHLKHIQRPEEKAKIARFLSSRGFDWDIIHRVIDSLLKKEYNEEEL